MDYKSQISRRTFMHSMGATAAGVALGPTVLSAKGSPTVKSSKKNRINPGSKGPNVIVVLSDQHRADYMGCAGHPILETPGWDRMAAEGVRFDNAYCGYPVCCPSRMSFLTGQLPSSIQCNDNVSQLGSDYPTVAHGFSAAGYETALIGRMHIIGFDQRHGFSERPIADIPGTAFFNAGSWGGRILGPLRKGTGASWNSLKLSGPGHMSFHTYDELVVNETVSRLQEWCSRQTSDRSPFFMVAGTMLPHPPFVALEGDYDKLRSKYSISDLPEPQLETLHSVYESRRKSKGCDRHEITDEARLRTMISYAANCQYHDGLMANLLNALDKLGLSEDTIVVYVSDHGEQMGAHGLWGKSTFYEESTRIPMIIRWPKGIAGGQTISQPVSLVDLGSTLLTLAGQEPLPDAQSEGFAPLVTKEEESKMDRGVVIEGVFKGAPARTIRQGKWRYSYYHGMEEELYDLESDPGEFLNLAGKSQFESVREQLARRAFEDWDPERLEYDINVRSKELSKIRSWIDVSELSEPDPPWHKGRNLVNYLNEQ